jgi:SOS-response transcriptional repressor LexA
MHSGRYVIRRMIGIIQQRIQERLKALADKGISARSASLKANQGSGGIADILSGRNKSPSVPVLMAIAVALETDLAYLTGERDTVRAQVEAVAISRLPLIGIAETGVFREMPRDNALLAEEPTIDAVPNPRYPRARQFAVEIRGDSMNAARPVPLFEGMMALCVDFWDARLVVESGKIYLVRRTLDGGHTYEWTIKEAMVFRDRVELHPRSTNSVHKPIIVPAHFDADETSEVRIIGLVWGSQATFPA